MASGGAVIGPNAVLQHAAVIRRHGGEARLAQVMAAARLSRLPTGDAMIPEGEAAALHRALRTAPDAEALEREAGAATADYILAHRIPAAAQRLLKALPAALAAPLLSRAIERNAWTFAGSGSFRRIDSWTFTLRDNPLVRGEQAGEPLCAWHAAVFERLYRVLVAPDCRCRETACAAAGAAECRFEIRRRPG
ncbi:bacteriochlorophyll 4-vinyl reductase [Phreatobacter sp.]|uniref:bacteriochlorophyll 4-vinyl reductase n=1 Tax=Phreatobacter sp. TaxID=1966341 RepID=UPI0022C14C77|nr:bacteriochlorophyll 4-vinyl reductase [Phreatobacter sp.]MCZ8316929.1 bacteriochlorophyll 4-vinyl reductase [Phreatobacter sp.]